MGAARVRARALVLGVALARGYEVHEDGSDGCPVGSAGCPCAEDGGCYDALECVDGSWQPGAVESSTIAASLGSSASESSSASETREVARDYGEPHRLRDDRRDSSAAARRCMTSRTSTRARACRSRTRLFCRTTIPSRPEPAG